MCLHMILQTYTIPVHTGIRCCTAKGRHTGLLSIECIKGAQNATGSGELIEVEVYARGSGLRKPFELCGALVEVYQVSLFEHLQHLT